MAKSTQNSNLKFGATTDPTLTLTNGQQGQGASKRAISAGNYVSLYDIVNKPDNRDTLVKTFGAQGITGFLQMVGAVKANGAADKVQYWEETRLHPTQSVSCPAIGAGDTTCTMVAASTDDIVVRLNDIVLVDGTDRAMVTNISGTNITLSALTTFTQFDGTSSYELPIVGNLYAEGTDQPTEFIESGITLRQNPYMIIKEAYTVSGSQATNIGWIDMGGGEYCWYMKNEADTRQRFMDKREMMMLLGTRITNTGNISNIEGSEGYFSAIEDRGLVQSGTVDNLADLDEIVKVFDKEGGASEYALYVDRAQDLKFDDLVANVGGTPTNGAAKFGSFSNDMDKAIALGFRSFNRGGYTFHKQSFKLLNDPTLLAINDASSFHGVAVPMAQVADPKTGIKSPALEMNYKNVGGYSREMEHWMVGSVLGAANATKDNVEFHYRSECNLITRAANQHLIIKGVAS